MRFPCVTAKWLATIVDGNFDGGKYSLDEDITAILFVLAIKITEGGLCYVSRHFLEFQLDNSIFMCRRQSSIIDRHDGLPSYKDFAAIFLS